MVLRPNELITGIMAGTLTGMSLVLILTLSSVYKAKKYNAAIARCEAELPRNQHCKIIGVIDIEKRNDQR